MCYKCQISEVAKRTSDISDITLDNARDVNWRVHAVGLGNVRSDGDRGRDGWHDVGAEWPQVGVRRMDVGGSQERMPGRRSVAVYKVYDSGMGQ